jgi:hypothetical protein
VRNPPGSTTVALMPSGATSLRSDSVSASIEAFTAE